MRAQGRIKTQRNINPEGKKKYTKISLIMISVAVALAMWLTMLFISNSIINESEHITVYRAKIDIPEGMKITSENFDTYVESYSIAEDLLPEGYITDKKKILDVFTNREYRAREEITISGISTEKSMTDYIDNPIEISVAVASLDAAVGGILREGDYVNIYSVSGNNNGREAELIISNAYITKALRSDGVEIGRSDTTSTATILNLIIPMDVERQFNEELLAGTIRMSLIYNPSSVSESGNVGADVDETVVETVDTEGTESIESTEAEEEEVSINDELDSEMSASELASVVAEADAERVGKLYNGTISIQVFGKVTECKEVNNNSMYGNAYRVELETDNSNDMSVAVYFSMDAWTEDMLPSKGDNVSIIGAPVFSGNEVGLYECTLVD